MWSINVKLNVAYNGKKENRSHPNSHTALLFANVLINLGNDILSAQRT